MKCPYCKNDVNFRRGRNHHGRSMVAHLVNCKRYFIERRDDNSDDEKLLHSMGDFLDLSDYMDMDNENFGTHWGEDDERFPVIESSPSAPIECNSEFYIYQVFLFEKYEVDSSILPIRVGHVHDEDGNKRKSAWEDYALINAFVVDNYLSDEQGI